MTTGVLKASIGTLHGRAVLDRRTRVLASKLQSLLPAGAYVLDVPVSAEFDLRGRPPFLWR